MIHIQLVKPESRRVIQKVQLTVQHVKHASGARTTGRSNVIQEQVR